MAEYRRSFHMYPETGWTEFRTTAIIADALIKLGYNVRFACDYIKPEFVMGRDIDVEAETARAVGQGADPETVGRMKGYTGLAAELDTGRKGPVTALRFDIDCVDTSETRDLEHFPVKEGFASRNSGRMHACGHDGHAAIGLALAEILMEERENLKGKVRLLFQPAEEGVRGAYAMTKAGLVDDADYFIALHLGLGRPTGSVFGGTKGFLCSIKLDADFRGVGAHAGGEPEKGRNALLAASTAALNIHAIAPNSEGATRVNVGVLNAGEGRNVVPPNAHMKMEMRGATDELLNYVYRTSLRILEGAAEMYGVELKTSKQGETVCADSDAELASLVAREARKIDGVTQAEDFQTMRGSDDACWFMKRVQERGGRATYIGIGANSPAGHHNGHFDFDEAAMPIALKVLASTLHALNA